MFVGDDVRPRRRRPLALIQHRDVFTPFAGKAAESVEKLQAGHAGRRCFWVSARLRTRHQQRQCFAVRFAIFWRTPRELLFERAAFGDKDHARHGQQQQLVGFGHHVGAQRINTARFVLQGLQAGRTQQQLKLVLQRLQITGRVVVENHQINRQALEPQIFMRAQHLPHHVQLAHFIDAHQHDGQIAAEAVLP